MPFTCSQTLAQGLLAHCWERDKGNGVLKIKLTANRDALFWIMKGAEENLKSNMYVFSHCEIHAINL